MAFKIEYSIATHTQIVEDIGERVARIRLSRNITQQQLAEQAGIGLRTLRRLEEGKNTSMETFIRVLGALGLKEHLQALLPDPTVRPIERVSTRGKERKRARPTTQAPPSQVQEETWVWGDETE